MVEWIYVAWKLGKTNDANQLILACSHVVNIMNKINNIPVGRYQLVGIIAMHCADFKDKWGNMYTPTLWSHMCLNIYTPEHINKECKMWYKILKIYKYNIKIPFGVGHIYDKVSNMEILCKPYMYIN